MVMRFFALCCITAVSSSMETGEILATACSSSARAVEDRPVEQDVVLGQQLLDDASRGEFANVLALIEGGANVDLVNQDGRTALCLAAEKGMTATVQALITAGASVDVGKPLLMIAASSVRLTSALIAGEHVKIVQALLEAGANPRLTDKRGLTALFSAALEGKAAMVRALVAGGADVNYQRSTIPHEEFDLRYPPLYGATALLYATYVGSASVVRALVEERADLNIIYPGGKTALMIAASKELSVSSEVVQALIDGGANIELTASHGRTALMFALEETHDERTHRALISASAHLEHKNDEGRTALLVAARHGRKGAVEALIARGANINHQDDEGWTALMMAAHRDYESVVQTLITAGANPVLTNNLGVTAFLLVGLNFRRLREILDRGVHVDQCDTNGITALMYAAGRGDLSAARALIARDANVDKQDTVGTTALMRAAREGNLEIVTALIDAGANVDQANEYGHTALMLAVSYGHSNIVAALQAARADFDLELIDGKTAFKS